MAAAGRAGTAAPAAPPGGHQRDRRRRTSARSCSSRSRCSSSSASSRTFPCPASNPTALEQAFEQSTVLGFLNIFSGGALANMSVAAMGVYPYITASIIMQLMIPLVPAPAGALERGRAGRKQINIYTHWLTVPMAFVQGYGQLIIVQSIAPGAIPQPRADRPERPADALGGHHDDRRHDVPRLARRADHREGHRQRHLDHHLRRHRRRPAAVHRRPAVHGHGRGHHGHLLPAR